MEAQKPGFYENTRCRREIQKKPGFFVGVESQKPGFCENTRCRRQIRKKPGFFIRSA